MDYERIQNVIDIPKMNDSTAAIIGTGGSASLIMNLVRCGIGGLILVDLDIVTDANLSRQDHDAKAVGQTKVEAVTRLVRGIRSDIAVTPLAIDITALDDDAAAAQFVDVDVFVAATDSFEAQARVNQLALKLNVPAVYIGLYEGGLAGEIVFWHPGLQPCFRCVCAKRYEAFETAQQEHRSIDPPSQGADIFAIQMLDAIAGQIIVGLIIRGTDNRFGRLIAQLDDRLFIQVQISPDFRFAGRDLLREKLQVPPDNDRFFSWNAIALRDPDGGAIPCPDCVKYRSDPRLGAH